MSNVAMVNTSHLVLGEVSFQAWILKLQDQIPVFEFQDLFTFKDPWPQEPVYNQTGFLQFYKNSTETDSLIHSEKMAETVLISQTRNLFCVYILCHSSKKLIW